jgi:hypothetical protein
MGHGKNPSGYNLKYYFVILLETLRISTKTSIGTIYVLGEIRNGHIPNTSQNIYSLNKLAQHFVKNWALKDTRIQKMNFSIREL